MELSKQLKLKGSEKDFYNTFIAIFRDKFNLTSKEVEVIGAILQVRSELSSKVQDKVILNKLLFSPEYKEKIAIIAGLTDKKSLDINYMANLKKKGVILEGESGRQVNPLFVVTVHKNKPYNLLLQFDVRPEDKADSGEDIERERLDTATSRGHQE